MKPNPITVTIPLGHDRTITIETGKLAKQACLIALKKKHNITDWKPKKNEKKTEEKEEEPVTNQEEEEDDDDEELVMFDNEEEEEEEEDGQHQAQAQY